MLDLKRIREDPEAVKQGAEAKGERCDIDRILELDSKRRELLKKAEVLKAQDKTLVGGGVSLEGNTILLGAHEDDELGPWAGAAVVFTHDGNTWKETVKLVSPGGAKRQVNFTQPPAGSGAGQIAAGST